MRLAQRRRAGAFGRSSIASAFAPARPVTFGRSFRSKVEQIEPVLTLKSVLARAAFACSIASAWWPARLDRLSVLDRAEASARGLWPEPRCFLPLRIRHQLHEVSIRCKGELPTRAAEPKCGRGEPDISLPVACVKPLRRVLSHSRLPPGQLTAY
jgi:hypothetical protein